MPFDGLGLHPTLLRGLAALGFTEPTPIQSVLLPPAIEGRDLVGLAPTGTGKTLAYVLPIAHRLLASPPPLLKGPKKRGGGKRSARVDPRSRLRALVLVPTRELAQQVAKDAFAITKGSLLQVGAVWGKSPIGPQKELIDRGVDLLVGTPGRVRELLDLDALSLAHVRYVVVDESDRMLDLGFLPQVEGILERMPPDRQMLFLSATFPPAVEELMARFLREPTRIEAGVHTKPAAHVGQTLHIVDDAFKTALTLELIAGAKRRGVLVFVRTRRRAGWVAGALRKHDVSTALLHGDRSQVQREKALEDFTNGDARVLVATDIAARGLHIPAAKTVINYDIPMMPEEYVHRVGRAGHGPSPRSGFAESFTFVTPEPDERERWKRVCRLSEVELVPVPVPDFSRWLRPEDRERLAAVERQAEAKKRARRDAAAVRALDDAEKEKREREKLSGANRKKTTKRAGKSKVQLRGGARMKPVDPKQRPGKGVKKIG
ncbi:MAG: DEAD/DEAH box helicase [Phycisphaerae bacterium]|nr:DEAD/DEAH box helicase [Phycisphaerae bacterium]